MNKSINLDYKKSTKGTHQFVTSESGAVTKAIYITKEAMPEAPKSITVTVEWTS